MSAAHKAHHPLVFEAEVREYDNTQTRVSVNNGSAGIGLGLQYMHSPHGGSAFAALTPAMARTLGKDLIERADEIDPPDDDEAFLAGEMNG